MSSIQVIVDELEDSRGQIEIEIRKCEKAMWMLRKVAILVTSLYMKYQIARR